MPNERKTGPWRYYDLYHHMAQDIVNDLTEFRKVRCDNPMGITTEKWDSILGEIIDGFQLIIDDETFPPDEYVDRELKKGKDYEKICKRYRQEQWNKQCRALKLFKKYFFDFWC